MHLGNLGNAAYIPVRLLRKDGLDAKLVFQEDDFVFGDPRWEDGMFELPGLRTYWDSPHGKAIADTLGPAWGALPPFVHPVSSARAWPLRSWLHAVGRRASFSQNVLLSLYLAKGNPLPFRLAEACGDADLVHSWDINTAYAPFTGRPFVAGTNGGDILDLPFRNTVHGRLQRAAYRSASLVMLSEPRYFPAAERLGLERVTHFPFVVDTERYYPASDEMAMAIRQANRAELLLVWPGRQNNREKGSDTFLRAFAKVARELDARLLVLACGQDADGSVALVRRLGIQDRVRFLPACAKQRLIRYYRASDATVDQFVLGWHGSTMVEAMACGSPVLIYIDPTLAARSVTGTPPVLNARTEREIADRLHEVSDPTYRRRLRDRGLAWVRANHGWDALGPRLRHIYEEAMAGPKDLRYL